MENTAKDRFDQDYKVIRSMLLKKEMSIKDAKDWLKVRYSLAIDAMQIALNDSNDKFCGTRADRDLKRDLKEMKEDDDE